MREVWFPRWFETMNWATMDFIAIDFETANPQRASVCAAGWAIVRGGALVDRGSWLCRPPAGYEEFGVHNVRVHGITAEMVAGQPSFAERLPQLLALLGQGLPIVAHNAVFDISVLAQALTACGVARPMTPHHCTLGWAKKLLDLPAYRLNIVCEHLGISLHHHDAGSDALAAAQVALHLAELVGASSTAELDSAAAGRSRW